MMELDALRVFTQPKLTGARLLMGLSGWMDGGDVSTGTIEWLVREFGAKALGDIDPEPFYIYNFPGSMEISALFRPHTKIEDGLITAYVPPRNTFYCNEASNLILFGGKEPNFGWEAYAECVFAVASMFDVKMIYFIGSVAGTVPHTRDPRLFSSISDARLKDELAQYGIRFSNYQGPASFVTLMLKLAAERDLPMATLVAEIPAYVQGRNPRCIEALARKLAGILGLHVTLDELRNVSDVFERRLNEVVKEKDELAELVHKLESDYDNEVFDTELGDLKDWLQQRGVSLD